MAASVSMNVASKRLSTAGFQPMCKFKTNTQMTPKRTKTVDFNLRKLLQDCNYLPERVMGPLQVKVLPGRGRGLVATEPILPGDLVMVLKPAGSALFALKGTRLLPEQMADHLLNTGISPGDEKRLSMLFSGAGGSQQGACTLQDFEKAEAAVLKKKKSAKGFANTPGAQQPGKSGAPFTEEQIKGVVRFNSWGTEYEDLGLTGCRGCEPKAVIGVWPEAAMMNHSCAPNTVLMAIHDRLVVRATRHIARDEEVMTNYMDEVAGSPLLLRRAQTQAAYGFECNCQRCQVEACQPAAVREALLSVSTWFVHNNVTARMSALLMGEEQGVATLSAEDAATVRELRVGLIHQLQQLEDVLVQHNVSRLESSWLKASCYGCYEMLAHMQQGTEADGPQLPASLLPLVEVFAPGSEMALYLAFEHLVAVVGQVGKEHPSTQAAFKQYCRVALTRYGRQADEFFHQIMTAREQYAHIMGRPYLYKRPSDFTESAAPATPDTSEAVGLPEGFSRTSSDVGSSQDEPVYAGSLSMLQQLSSA